MPLLSGTRAEFSAEVVQTDHEIKRARQTDREIYPLSFGRITKSEARQTDCEIHPLSLEVITKQVALTHLF